MQSSLLGILWVSCVSLAFVAPGCGGQTRDADDDDTGLVDDDTGLVDDDTGGCPPNRPACGAGDDDVTDDDVTDDDVTDDDVTDDDVTDDDVDPCELAGWYGNGVCDGSCPLPDPDCADPADDDTADDDTADDDTADDDTADDDTADDDTADDDAADDDTADDDTADDDTADDDTADDDATGSGRFEGSVYLDVDFFGWYAAPCSGDMAAELDLGHTRLDGGGDCSAAFPFVGTVAAELVLSCDLAGANVSGELLMYDPTGGRLGDLRMTITGVYDDAGGAIILQVLPGTGDVSASGSITLSER